MSVFRSANPQPIAGTYTPATAQPYSAIRSITAAASQIDLRSRSIAEMNRKRSSTATAQWQSEAWDYYDAIGEIKSAYSLVGSVISRVRLYAAVIDSPGESPVPTSSSETITDDRTRDAAVRTLQRLDSAYGGQPGLLRDAALNLSVAGECYLVQVPARQGSGIPESWDIRSTDEIHVTNDGQYFLSPSRSVTSTPTLQTPGVIKLPEDAFVGRIWRAHPRYSDEPDSSLLGILDLCAELLALNQAFRASIRSRLNAGLLYIPDGLSAAHEADQEPRYDEEGNLVEDPYASLDTDEQADSLEESLIEGMTTPIRDEDSVASVVPIIVRGPEQYADKIKHITFERPFTEAQSLRADRVLDRILQGLDIPKDIVTGLASVKYSNAIQIDETLYKAHIEPLLLLIVDALTTAYFRPALRAQKFDEADVQRMTIWYDPSAIATRNDRAEDADRGYEKGLISGSAWRRAHGYSDSDAPGEAEFVLRLLKEKGALTPEITEALLPTFAPEVMDIVRQNQQSSSVAPVPAEVTRALQSTPEADATESTPEDEQTAEEVESETSN